MTSFFRLLEFAGFGKRSTLMEAMSPQQALTVFKFHGADATGLDAAALKKEFRKLAMANHPDRGGDEEKLKEITQAYAVLEKSGTGGKTSDSYGNDAQYGTHAYRNTDDGGEYPVWAMAGHSGGMRSNARIRREDYHDLNFIKKTMWELSGQSRKEYTVWQFDGQYFRHVFTVYGSPEIYEEMTKAMIVWGSGSNPYHTAAILIQTKRDGKRLYITYANGESYAEYPVEIYHDSFNDNPGNDTYFVSELQDKLEELKDVPQGQSESPDAVLPPQ